MGDEKKWFKVWTSILHDPDFQNMPIEDVGRWVYMGALIASSGSNGSVRISGIKYLKTLFQISEEDEKDLFDFLANLPHIIVSDAPISWPHGRHRKPVCEGTSWRGGHVLTWRGSNPPHPPGSEGCDEWCEEWADWCGEWVDYYVTFENWDKFQTHIPEKSGVDSGLKRGGSGYEISSGPGKNIDLRRDQKRSEEIREEKKRKEYISEILGDPVNNQPNLTEPETPIYTPPVPTNFSGYKPEIPIPPDFKLDDFMKAEAAAKGVTNVEEVFEAFCSHYRSNEKRYTNWRARWTYWLTQQSRYPQAKSGTLQKFSIDSWEPPEVRAKNKGGLDPC